MTRLEAFEEYFRIAGFVQAYDAHFVGIKTWGVTLTGGSLAIGFTQDTSGSPWMQLLLFVMALLLALSFWFAEVYFKLLQLAHIPRVEALEKQLASGAEILDGPSFLASYEESKKAQRAAGRWRDVLIVPHVLIPHLPLAVVSALLAAISLVRFIWS